MDDKYLDMLDQLAEKGYELKLDLENEYWPSALASIDSCIRDLVYLREAIKLNVPMRPLMTMEECIRMRYLVGGKWNKEAWA